MQIFNSIEEAQKAREDSFFVANLAYTANLNANLELRRYCHKTLMNIAHEKGIYLASDHELYMAMGRGEITNISIPALNVRSMTYDLTKAILELADKYKVGTFVYELARSEMGYTAQSPMEYVCSILAAAIDLGHRGPLFVQGDHFQFDAKQYAENPQAETQRIKELTQISIEAGFYNIDIDASTLVNLDKDDLNEQQIENYTRTAEITKYIRSIEPKGITVSIGGEIGHIGGRNSTVEDFEAFMAGYLKSLESSNLTKISKISVQTGTSHGGVPLANGTLADIDVDFSVLRDIGKLAKEKYNLGGAVQHGASTLPDEYFNEFVKAGAAEVHLATEMQNIIYENLPEVFVDKITQWILETKQDERQEGWTDEQFVYKLRKKAFGAFEMDLWTLDVQHKQKIIDAVSKKVEFWFESLNVFNTQSLVKRYIK